MGADIVKKKMLNKCDDIETISSKHLELFIMMNQWIKVKQEGKSLANYLEEKGYFNIAIYGMSDAGQRLYEELNGTSIKIEYAIDRRTVDVAENIPIVSLDNVLHKVDAIVVTAIYDFPEIVKLLQNKTQDYIISLEQIIYEL